MSATDTLVTDRPLTPRERIHLDMANEYHKPHLETGERYRPREFWCPVCNAWTVNGRCQPLEQQA